MQRQVTVIGSGTYLPGDPIPVEEIDAVLGELTEAPARIQRWMRSTGRVMRELLDIRWVHYAIDPVSREFVDDNVTMSVKAAHRALEAAGLVADDIDLICYGSAHQDQMPTASVRIQEQLGIEICDELAIHANCTSAYKALYLAHELIKAGKNRHALVLSSSVSSSELRAEYYNQARVDKESLFLRWFLSDGAGALVLSGEPPAAARRFEVEHSFIESIGGKRPSLMFNERPSLWLNPQQEYEQGLHHLRQRFRNALGTELFQEADGSVFFNGLKRMLREGQIPIDKIRYLQVNLPAKHIVESVVDECVTIGIPKSALWAQLDELGYCGPPMALISLDHILRDEPFDPGDRVVSFVTEVSKFMQAGYCIRYAGEED